MTSIGNDIVDLTSPDSIGKSRDRRFIARVFTPEEQERIDRSPSPDTALWMFWAAKEAAFKAVYKLKPGLSFVHRAYAVTAIMGEAFPTAFPGPPPSGWPLFSNGEGGLCSGSRGESGYGSEPVQAAPVILKRTNGDTMPIQGRGVVMTPAGPVDAFFTVSDDRIHCVAAARKVYGGAPASTPVHVLEERRDDPLDPSAAVRRAAIHHLASVMKTSPYHVSIRRDKTPHGYGAPRVFIEGNRTDIEISLSHDGRYIAFAVHH